MKLETGKKYNANPEYTALIKRGRTIDATIRDWEIARLNEKDWAARRIIDHQIENYRKDRNEVQSAKMKTEPWIAA